MLTVICEHGLTVEGETTREQLHDLMGGSFPRLIHYIRCLKGQRGHGAHLRQNLAKQAVARLHVYAGMHQDDAKRRIQELADVRIRYGV